MCYISLTSMSAAAAAQTHVSPEEYLAKERAGADRHEYVGGEIFAMAGCSGAHDALTASIIGALDQALPPGPCQPFTSDMRIFIPATGTYTYSDGMVACGPQYTDEAKETIENPCVIFEVLSDSTEAYDRGKKFDNYRSIPSLQDYVLVSQHQMLVEHYSRQGDGTWTLRVLRRAGEQLRLSAVPVEIVIDRLYRRLGLPAG